MIKHLFVILFLFNSFAFSQTDWIKWEKAEISYKKKVTTKERDFSISSSNVSEIAIKSIANAYWFLLSDVDGDNCPFHPTCSSFFLQASGEKNILIGTLSFFDRLTRDASVIGRNERYPKLTTGKLYDPVEHHTDFSSIDYIPSSKIVFIDD